MYLALMGLQNPSFLYTLVTDVAGIHEVAIIFDLEWDEYESQRAVIYQRWEV